MKNKEIEKKFLIEQPDDYRECRCVSILQGHNGSFRLRQEAHYNYKDKAGFSFFLTAKSGKGKIREQFETRIYEKQFKALWPVFEKVMLRKMRWFLPYGGSVIEMDLFFNELAGLVIAEVEFDSIEECDAFIPPKWFGREVTDDKRYTNHSLALHGLPKD